MPSWDEASRSRMTLTLVQACHQNSHRGPCFANNPNEELWPRKSIKQAPLRWATRACYSLVRDNRVMVRH